MKIIDIEGNEIEVTDLDKAIRQADEYRHFRHDDRKSNTMDDYLTNHWQYIYEQLLILKHLNRQRS